MWVVVLVGLLVVGLGGGGLWWWLSRPAGDLLASSEVFLEPSAEPGLEAFTESVAVATPLSALRPLPVTAAPAGPAGSGEPLPPDQVAVDAGGGVPVAVVGVEATRPGLYGGTRDNASCDVERLIGFLQADAGKAAAFASVQGVAVGDLPGYLRSLTPLILRNDTRVINHGFANGRATPRHAVLQAGSAVLVDAYGVPRVRCACGNPLLPARPVAGTPEYTGTSWPGFQPTRVITIVNVTNVTVSEFVIIEVTTGEYLTRQPGGGVVDVPIPVAVVCDRYPQVCRDDPVLVGGTPPGWREGEVALASGEVQITLRWDGPADLDLSVTDPDGQTVFYGNPESVSGGRLDVDANSACQDASPAPVENIVWGSDAPVGRYVAEVVLYDLCGASGPVAFTLTALVGGVPVEVVALGSDPVATAPIVPVVDGSPARPQLMLAGWEAPGCPPRSGPTLRAASLPLAQAASGSVSPDQPRVYFAVDKPPDGGSQYDPPPTITAPPPGSDPPPTITAPPPGSDPPGGEDPDCDCDSFYCGPTDECAPGSPVRSGAPCMQQQLDPCRLPCCGNNICELLGCVPDYSPHDLLCVAGCSD